MVVDSELKSCKKLSLVIVGWEGKKLENILLKKAEGIFKHPRKAQEFLIDLGELPIEAVCHFVLSGEQPEMKLV